MYVCECVCLHVQKLKCYKRCSFGIGIFKKNLKSCVDKSLKCIAFHKSQYLNSNPALYKIISRKILLFNFTIFIFTLFTIVLRLYLHLFTLTDIQTSLHTHIHTHKQKQSTFFKNISATAFTNLCPDLQFFL